MRKIHTIHLDGTTGRSGIDGKKVVVEIGQCVDLCSSDSREIKVVHPIANGENESPGIHCTTFQTKEEEEEFFDYMEKFDDDWEKLVLKTSPFERENRTRQEIEKRLKVRRTTHAKTEHPVLALKTLCDHCPREEWIHFAAFVPEHREKLTYPQFYEIAMSIFQGEQAEIDDSELRGSPVLLSLFGEANLSVYIDGDKFSNLNASGFNSSYLHGMAQTITNCETLGQFSRLADGGSAANTSTCLCHFPREQYSIFDTSVMKDVYDGRTSYIVFPFTQFSETKPFTREDSARTVLRCTMDTIFFTALNQARFWKVKNVFLAGNLEDCMETIRHSVMTHLPILDKFNIGCRLNVFIIKPASYLAAIGALLSNDV